MTELKPCPFCGGDNMYLCAHYDCYAEHYGVFCNDCKTWFSNENYEEDEDGTRNWWNTRAERTCIEKECANAGVKCSWCVRNYFADNYEPKAVS